MEIIDTTNWGGRPFEQYQRWEQREMLSFLSNLPASTNMKKIKEIISAFRQHDNDYTWSQLDLNDEAWVQYLLRNNGFALQCYNLNKFPTSIIDLCRLTKRLPVVEYIKLKWPTNLYHRFLGVETVVYILIALAGLIYYKFDLIWWSLLASWAMANTALNVLHEYWSHGAITPRNRVFAWILEIYGYLITIATISDKKQRQDMTCAHHYHHRYFKDLSRDNINSNLENNNWFRYIFKFNMYVTPEINKFYAEESERDFAPIYNKFGRYTKFVCDHTRIVLFLVHLTLFLLLGIKYYLYFVIIPILFYDVMLYTVVEWTFWKFAKNDENLPILFPIILGSAYHNDHHRWPGAVIVGPRPWRYLNPQYWFIRIFFTTKSRII